VIRTIAESRTEAEVAGVAGVENRAAMTAAPQPEPPIGTGGVRPSAGTGVAGEARNEDTVWVHLNGGGEVRAYTPSEVEEQYVEVGDEVSTSEGDDGQVVSPWRTSGPPTSRNRLCVHLRLARRVMRP
jgi:hypothetical protein